MKSTDTPNQESIVRIIESKLIEKPPKLSHTLSKDKFPCNQCGWCCQNLQNQKLYESLDSGNGECIHFEKTNNNCGIYEDRPLICNIEAMYFYAFSTMNYEDYINLNISACQKGQIENNLPIIQV